MQRTRRRAQFVLRSALAASLSLLVVVAVAPSAFAYPAVGQVLVSGSQWLNGGGVDVYSNGSAGNTSGKYQCVELAQRLYPSKHWATVYAANGIAADIPEGSPGLTREGLGANSYVPVPGDLVIENPTQANSAGHVAIVDSVAGSTIDAVEQNASATGKHRYTLGATGISGGYGSVKAILHAPQNTMTSSSNPPVSSGPTAPTGSGTQMMRTGDNAVYAKNTIGNGGWVQEVGPGNASAIAVGGNTQMFLRGDSAVFAKSGIGNGGWVQETNPATANLIAVSSTGVQMMRTGDNAVYAKNTIGNGGWVQEVGPGNASAIAVGGNTQMFLRGDSAVFATNTLGGPWTQETPAGNATAISVGVDGTQMFLRGDSTVFAKNGIGNGGWVQETNPATANLVAIG